MGLQQLIEKQWYQDPAARATGNFRLNLLLWPLALIYRLLSHLRRSAYHYGWLKSYKLAVPLVIVGNISVGGAGKTPLCKHLAEELSQAGYSVGIILRGYKGSNRKPRLVSATDSSQVVGDEALIYAQAGLKVAIGSNRVAAGELLLIEHPDIQLIIADDGLQHYRLQRDLEICVVDSTRLFGNCQLLPLGPLRENLARLKSIDAIVVNGSSNAAAQIKLWSKLTQPIYQQRLIFQRFYNPKTTQTASLTELNQRNCQAIAAIGNPQRFFNYLQQLGLKTQHDQAFPDHYHYQLTDINPNCAIITTEKDYTKLAQFDLANIWVTQVAAQLNNDQLLTTIKNLIPASPTRLGGSLVS